MTDPDFRRLVKEMREAQRKKNEMTVTCDGVMCVAWGMESERLERLVDQALSEERKER